MNLRERFLGELLPHADETVLAAVWFHDAIYDGETNLVTRAEPA